MDRSYLSNAEVIAASREFVCVRLLSYENQAEMDFLKRVGAGKSGEAENTVVCVFKPDGKTPLTRAARSTHAIFGSPSEMVTRMQKIADAYPRKKNPEPSAVELPTVASVKLALNVAACDAQPLVLVLSISTQESEVEKTLAELAWSRDYLGKFVYARATAKDLALLEGVAKDSVVVVVEPDPFGVKGQVIGQSTTPTRESLTETLRSALGKGRTRTFDFGEHVRSGKQRGVFWETNTPVTDPMEAKARERGRKGF